MASNVNRSAEPTAGADRSTATDRYTLTVDKARLATAPSFDRAQWPKAGDSGIYTESDTFFGGSGVAGTPDARSGRPVEAGTSSPTYFRASQLRNQAVNDSAGMPIGTLGQLVIDPVQGRVNYATFSTTGSAGATGRTVALPWQTIRASQRDQKDRFELTVPQDRLQGAPEFQNGDENWKHMSDANYVHDVYGYYSVRPYWNDDAAGRGTKPNTNGKNNGAPDDAGGRKDGGNENGNQPKRGGNTGGGETGKDTGGQGGGNPPPHRS
jgi:sporulation protein YlmC with PRC-barrel domain